jgi:hypothetical protein
MSQAKNGRKSHTRAYLKCRLPRPLEVIREDSNYFSRNNQSLGKPGLFYLGGDMPSGFYITEKSIKELERVCNQAVKYMDAGKTKLLLEQANLVKEGIKKTAAAQQKGSVNHSAQKAAYAAVRPSTTAYPTTAYAGIRPKKMPHAHLVEEGHDIKRVKKGPVVGHVEAHSFVQKTWDEMKPGIRQDIEVKTGQLVDSAFTSGNP